jgi:hypothetical protein
MNTLNQKNRNHNPAVNIEYSVQFSEKSNCLPVITEDYVEDDTHRLLGEFALRHSTHSYKKARMRGFTTEELLAVIEYGDVYVKQDLCFYIARRKHLIPYLDKKLVDRLNNMVVVTNVEGDCIVTCYKSKDSSAHLKRKGKRLLPERDPDFI